MISTSRRPCHRSRLLGREFSRVLPNSIYVPRGTKPLRELIVLAKAGKHGTVTLINSLANEPRELAFLKVDGSWRWLDQKIELKKVTLQADIGQKVRLSGVRLIPMGSAEALRTAGLLSEAWRLPVGPASGGAEVLISDDGGLKIQFQRGPEIVGPILHISKLRRLRGEG